MPRGLPALLARLLGAALLLSAGCSGSGTEGPEQTVLSTRSGESVIQVTQGEVNGNQVVRIKTVFQGKENSILLNIDEPIYSVEIPLTLEQTLPQATAAAQRGNQGQFEDLLIAQYLEKAQQVMMEGDYNAALRQINLVLLIKPDHIQAHTMKGSVYYALGNYQLASEEWQYVLSLDPSNKEVNDFMDFMKNRQALPQPPLPGSPVGQPGQGGGTTPAGARTTPAAPPSGARPPAGAPAAPPSGAAPPAANPGAAQ
jgi:tetratricopeptide (TPR) repeat protein